MEKNNSRFVTWTRWFESNSYDVVENMYNTHSEYCILEFEGYCVAKKKYRIPTREKFVELLDYINNVVCKDYMDKKKVSPYIEEFIAKNNLKEECVG